MGNRVTFTKYCGIVFIFLFLLAPPSAQAMSPIFWLMGGGSSCMPGNDENCVLMIHSDDPNGSTSIVDSSKNGNGGTGHAITVNNSVEHNTKHYKFGHSGVSFAGTTGGGNDYISLADHADWDFDSQDFTIAFWAYFTVLGINNVGLYVQYTDTENEHKIEIDNATLQWKCDGDTGVDINLAKAGFVTDTWYHIACVKNGSTWTMYRNGVSVASTTDANDVPDLGEVLEIGFYLANDLNGILDEYIVVKGKALWTKEFSGDLPNKPYCDD